MMPIFRNGKLAFKCYETKADTLTTPLGDGYLTWVRWKVDRIVWGPVSGILFLQGVSLRQLLNPLIPLSFASRRVYDPEPGLDDVVLAAVKEVPEGLSDQQLLGLLLAAV